MKIVEYPWGCLYGEAEHFYLSLHKDSGDERKGNVVLKASINFQSKKGRLYEIESCLFDIRDYKDEETAREEAKNWLFDIIEQLSEELHSEERDNR